MILYTDGSCLGNPGPGGYAVILKDGSNLQTIACGGCKLTTNNIMELTAAIEAIRHVPENNTQPATIITDSKYTLDGITSWIVNWKKRGWKTADGKPVKNKELWVTLDTLCTNRNVVWKWVKAHNGDPGNECADNIARREAAKYAAK